MDLELVSWVLNWVAHIDPACVVCQWDPESGNWVPYTGAAGAAAGAAAAASSSAGPPRIPVPPGTHSAAVPPGIPVPPGTHDADVPYGPRGTAPPNPYDRQGMSPEERALADEWESERLRDQSRAHHPEEWETTAGPPEPTMADEVGDAAYNSFFTLGTRPRVN